MMKEISWDEYEEFADNCEEICSELFDQSRWTTTHRVILQASDGRFYRALIRKGSTEYQECDDNPMIEEVVPYEKLVTRYRSIG